jgi:hypothetical protein
LRACRAAHSPREKSTPLCAASYRPLTTESWPSLPEAEYHEEVYRLTVCDGLTQVFRERYLVEALDKEILCARTELANEAAATMTW